MELSTIYENKGYLSCYLPLFQTDACLDGPPNITICPQRTLWRKKIRTYRSLVLSPPLMVLLWEQVAAPIWRSRGVENCVELNGTTSRDLSVFDCGEQQKTHKCKCRVSRRKVRETHCGEAFGWLVCGRCLQCERNIFSISVWRFINQCGCSSADGAFVSILHLRGCNWTTLSSSKHQLLLRWNRNTSENLEKA